MIDLSREEKIEKRIAELERQIYVRDEALDKEQGRRLRSTFFVICGIIYIVLLYFALKNGISINGMFSSGISFELMEGIFYTVLGLTAGVGFIAGLIMFVSYAVLAYIVNGAMNRAETIARLNAELNTLKNFDTMYK